MSHVSTPTPHVTGRTDDSTATLLDSISIRGATWRRRITIAFALMSVIPLLTFTYFAITYLLPNIGTDENMFLIMLLNVAVVSAGYCLLWKTGKDLSTLSECVRRVAQGTLSWAHAASSDREIMDISGALADIVRNLKDDKQALSEASSRLEHEVQSRMDEVDRANQALRRTNMELSRALEEIHTTQAHLIAQERINALSQMASGIAHDFNNTLMPIVGLSHFLLAHPEIMDDRAELIDTLQDIRSAGEDAKKVVGRLREFYRADDSGAPVNVCVADVLEAAIQATQPRWEQEMRSRNTPMTIERHFDKTDPVQGNANLLKEVFINIILNAVDASPKGGPIILSTTAEEGWVVVRVADKGIGMSPEAARRCIEPFYTTKNDKGSGLGLSMSYGVVRRHGGTLTVESEPDKGTTIQLRFPSATLKPNIHEDAWPTLDQLRILVVDDDPRSRKLMSRILAAGQHDVTFATDGKEGLAAFASASFDAVITDRAMPDMNGDAFARAIREKVPAIPVVMVTGFGDLMKSRDALPTGIDALVAKPVTEQELHAALSIAISRHRPDSGAPHS